MYRPTFAAILLSTSLLAGGAWAQSADTSTSSPAAPAASAPAGGKFVTAQGNTEFKASKFVGIDVYGSDGEKIGDITEVLLDASGSAKAIVIGVGGFLGMGQKNVAVPWSSVTWANEAPAPKSASASPSGERPAATGTTSPATPAGGGAMGGSPRPPSAAPTRSPAEQAAYNGYPDHAKVQLSKSELTDAPAFKYVADSSSPSGTK